MSHLKYTIAAFAVALFITPSLAEAQSFQTLGLRRGAVGGAILGAIIGDQNNEAFAGAAIGGLVGGTIGNVSGRNLDRQFAGGPPIYNYGGNRGGNFNRPAPYTRAVPVYRPSPAGYRGGGGGYGRPGYGRPGCGGRGF